MCDKELKMMKSIYHPNVVGVVSANKQGTYIHRDGTQQQIMYILMEYCSSGELIEYLIQAGGFPDPIVRAYFKQLLDGVEACHLEGVSHRDLKPENILLDS